MSIDAVRADLLDVLLAAGALPVVAPAALDPDGIDVQRQRGRRGGGDWRAPWAGGSCCSRTRTACEARTAHASPR